MNVRAKLFAAPEQTQYYSPKNIEAHKQFWLNSEPSLDQVTLPLPASCIDEIDAIANRLDSVGVRGLPNESSARVAELMPLCRELAAEVVDRLEHAAGVVLIDRFPVERYSDEANRTISGLFASMMYRLMDQDYVGTQLYDVVNKPPKKKGPVRRSKTNVYQDYHTDGGWVDPPSCNVGLFCIRNAQRGGHSRVTSLLAAYATLKESHPEVIACLSKPHPWDKQGEHAEGDVRYAMRPLFAETESGFLARYYDDYVRNGYKLLGKPIDPQTDSALTILAKTIDEQPRIRFMMEAGQFQLANNYTVVHAREAFDDGEDPDGGRHLVRIWHQRW